MMPVAVDHLVALPWTGSEARHFVPTVPACHDCNVRIGDDLSTTIVGRCEPAAASLMKSYHKQLEIPDRTPKQLAEYGKQLRAKIAGAQAIRREIRRRLVVLEAGGAPYVPARIL